METITFRCKIITPMFLAGADGRTPELRAPSIKGALRFWWRAVHGHLSLDKLRKQEMEIFGGTGPGDNGGRRSRLIIRIPLQSDLNTYPELLVPHKPFMKAPAIQPGSKFDVMLSLTRGLHGFGLGHLKSLFELTCILGGFGKRVRRGMGSVQIINSSFAEQPPSTIELPHIHQLISTFSRFYDVSKDEIVFNYSGRTNRYPFIKQIELGKSKSNLLRAISNATHEVKQKDPYAYEPSMGHAYRGRFASPIYASTDDSKRVIITTLNPVPDKNEHKISRLIQEEFKEKLL